MHVLHNFFSLVKHNSLPLGPIQPSSPSTKQLHAPKHAPPYLCHHCFNLSLSIFCTHTRTRFSLSHSYTSWPVWPDWHIFERSWNKFSYRGCSNIYQLLGLFWRPSKFWALFGKKGHFLFHHLVTLLMVVCLITHPTYLGSTHSD